MSVTSDARPLVNESFEDGDMTLQNPVGNEQPHVKIANNTVAVTSSDDVPLDKRELQSSQPILSPTTSPARSWNPITLRPWFAACLIITMIAVAIALEIALHFSQIKNGWNTSSAFSATNGILHYVYTLPPVAVAMIIVALWAWTDVDIKRMQPYIDLAYGNAPASRTLLLDYSSKHPALVSYFAFKRSHWIVATSSVMVLIGLALQPLAASLFTVRNIWWDGPTLTISLLQEPSQVGDLSRVNMSTFLTSAGFVQANVLFNATPPNFVDGVWTIARVQIPKDIINNGTMFPITESYRSTANCELGENINFSSNASPIVLSATSGNCSANITFSSIPTSTQFGVVPASCPDSNANEDIYSPIAFYTVFSNSSNPDISRTIIFCRPKIEAFKTNATVAIQTGQLLAASIVEPLDVKGTMADPQSPGSGRPLNGIVFSWLGNDSFTNTLVDSVRSGLSNAVVQNVSSNVPGGLQGAMSGDAKRLVSATEVSYSLYLSLVARELYFSSSQSEIQPPTPTKTFIPRLFIVPATSHILTATLLLFAILAGLVHYSHYHTRELVVLPLRPGTLGSAAVFTARSNLAQLLETNDVDVRYLDEKRLAEILSGKLYGIDKGTGRVAVLQDRPQHARGQRSDGTVRIDVPVQRRRSVMALLTRPKESV